MQAETTPACFDARKGILDALMDLNDGDFSHFIFELKNDMVNPPIRTSEVQRKSRVEVTELLMSRHDTESEAVDRTIRALRAIYCNKGATKLESRKEAHSNNLPSLNKPDPAAKPPIHETNNVPKMPQKVKIAAPKAEKLPDSGDVVGSHQMERENGRPDMKHKDDECVSHFPDAEEKVRLYKEGQALVGFGQYKTSTRKDLFESTDKKKKESVLQPGDSDHLPNSTSGDGSWGAALPSPTAPDESPQQHGETGQMQTTIKSTMSSAKDFIRRNKTSLWEILSAEHMLILNKVQEHSLISNRAIQNLKDYNENAKGQLCELLDKLMKKGEKTCQIFIKLLKTDDVIQRTFPNLRTIQWTVDNSEKQGAKSQKVKKAASKAK